MIQDITESRNIGHRVTIRSSERSHTNGCRQSQISSNRILSELLEEGEEVGRIVSRDGVASQALLVRIFPTGKKDQGSADGLTML